MKLDKFEPGWSAELEGQAEAAIRALRSGAHACSATVFISAGGSSLARDLVWPGLGLQRLSVPRIRADLSCAVEEALPGWQWSITEIPSATAAWPMACFKLSPMGMLTRGDSELVQKALNSEKNELAPITQAIQILDQVVGERSARFLHFSALGGVDIANSRSSASAIVSWRVLRDLGGLRSPGPGLGLAGLSAALQAHALAYQLSQDGTGATPDAAGKLRI